MTPRDLTSLLHDGAGPAASELDVDAAWRRGRTRRRRKRLAGGALGLAAAIVLALAAPGLLGWSDDLIIEPVDRPEGIEPGDVTWGARLGSDDAMWEPVAVRSDRNEGLVVVSRSIDPSDPEDGPTGAVLSMVDAHGGVRSVQDVSLAAGMDGASRVEPTGLITTSEGDSVVIGHATGQIGFNGEEVEVGSTPAGFIGLQPHGDGWGQPIGRGSGEVRPATVAATTEGDLFVTGTLNGNAAFGPIRISAGDGQAIFAVRLDQEGRFHRARLIGATSAAQGLQPTSSAATPDGGVIVTGIVSEAARFGGTNIDPQGSASGFAMSMDAEGRIQWVIEIGAADDAAVPRDVDVLPGGDILVVGDLRGAATFGEFVLDSGDATAGFVARLSPEGSVRWAAKTDPGPESLHLVSVSTGSGGVAYAVGWFTGPVDPSGTALEEDVGSTPGGVLVRIDAQGTLEPSPLGNGTGTFLPTALTHFDADRLAIVGTWSGSVRIDGRELPDASIPNGFVLQLATDDSRDE